MTKPAERQWNGNIPQEFSELFATEAYFRVSVNMNNYHSILNLNKALSSDHVIRKCFIIGSFYARENVSNQLHVYHL